MEDPNVSVIEKFKDASSQEGTLELNHSLFASEYEVFPDNDSGESSYADGVLSANTGIIICSAPETPNSKDDTISQTEEFKIPPEESRRSISCEEPPRLLPTGGDLKSDGSDSDGESQGDDLKAADAASAYLKNESPPGMMNENLGFTKTKISEMMEILSDGKTRGRDVQNVELKQFYIKKRDADSKDIKPSPKKLKATTEEELATESPEESIEIQKATIKADTVNPLKVEDNILVTKGNIDVGEKVQSTEPLETVEVEDNIDEVAAFCDKDEEHFTNEQLDLVEETAEEGIAGENGNRGSDGVSNKRNDDIEAKKGDEEDEEDSMKNEKNCSEEGKGDADEGVTDGMREKRNFLYSIVRPVKGGIIDEYTMMRNLLDVLGGGCEKTTKNGDNEDERAEKISDSGGGARVVDEDSAAKENGEDTIKRLLEENGEDIIKRRLVEENGEDIIKCLLEVLGVLTQGIQRKYHHGEVDLYETAKRHGMKFPRPRWWPKTWKK